MKHLLIGAAAATALVVAAPVWAQPAPTTAPPSATSPAPAAAPVQPMNRMPAGGRATSERGATGSVTRAHHRRHAVHAAKRPSSAKHSSAGNAANDNVANQLNSQELAGFGAGNPTTMNRMPMGGRATSGGPNQ